ncbi:MAG TPA: PAC2 family protein [Ilumatobacteraceae bacterium]|nr:PAC2 family protein [Ilumatobacteraceae bacterium]
MTDLYTIHGDLPDLDGPVMVIALQGWIDASAAAATALGAIEESCALTSLATFDSDRLIDYRSRRPVMELRDGVNTRLVWHDIELKGGADPGERAVLTLTGPEPDSQWRGFAAAVASLAQRLGVSKAVALGAYPFACPHTRPSRLSSSSPSADVVAGLPFLKNSVDVPAGMSAVLEHALTDAGVPSLGLWVQVPHYVSAMAYPAASAALLEGLRDVTGITVPHDELDGAAVMMRERIDQLVRANAEHREMVEQLELAYDAATDQSMMLGTTEIPTGDDLAAEFERFLRDQPE